MPHLLSPIFERENHDHDARGDGGQLKSPGWQRQKQPRGRMGWRKAPVSTKGKSAGEQRNSPAVGVIRVGLPMLGATPDGPAPDGQNQEERPGKGLPGRRRIDSGREIHCPARGTRRPPGKKAKIGISLMLTSKTQLDKSASTSHEL
jgi:hypothetical protein